MNDLDVAAIERATVSAVAAEAVEEHDGWLLPFDSGTIARAKAAVPLRHVAAAPDVIDAIEARYRARGLPAVFRLADAPCLADLTQALQRKGYEGARPTQVQIGSTRAMRQVSQGPLADVDRRPDAAWEALFLGEGFDPVDGACRVAALGRAPDSIYASVRQGGRTLACGTVAFGEGWASVHGMRTEKAQRGRGLAGSVLAALAQAALDRGVARVFLQVEDNNPSAHALYRRAGFDFAWRYRYWQRPH